jgi:tetratricopeptide (TPR) repeat protein
MRKTLLFLFVLLIVKLHSYAQLDIGANIDRARKEIFEDKNQLAIERLNRIINLKPDQYLAYFFRGIAKFGLNDYTGAIEDFNQVIKFNPFLPDAFHYRGVAKNALKDYNSALNDYDKAAMMDVNNPGILISRGLTKISIKNYSSAIEDFNKAIRLNPNLVDVYLYRAMAKSGLKNYESAINDCNYAIGLNQFNYQAFVRRGLIKHEQEKFEEAIKDYNHALKLNSEDAYTYYVRAIANYRLENYTGALNDYNRVIELNPYNALAYYNRSMLKIELENKGEAILDLTKVIELSPMHVLSYYNRGMLLGEQKKYLEALNDFSKAIELYPDFGEAYYMRSIAKRQLGQMKAAQQDYTIAQAKMEAQNKDTTIARINAKKYQKLIELEADFNNNMVGGDRIYSVYSGIDPLPDYLLNLFSKKPRKIIFADLVQYDSLKFEGLYLSIDNRPDTVIHFDLVQKKIDKVLKKDSVNYTNWYIKGLIDSRLKNYNSAISAFSKAIKLNPDFVFALLGRANAQLEMMDFINSIDEGINLTVDGKTKQISTRQEKVYDYTNVINDYNQAISINPDLAIAYYNRANVKVKAKDFKGALFDYQRSIKLEPDFADAYYNMALLMIHQQNIAEACLALSKAGELGQEKAYLVIQRYCKK